MSSDTTLLLADDHAVIRTGLRVLLESEGGYRVVGEANDGREAIELARETKPDVVVMDITMPGINGIEATRTILAENPNTRVLTLSVHSTKGFVRDMLEAGASGYILKQSAPEELVLGIQKILEGEVFLGQGVQDLVVADYVSGLSEMETPHSPTPVPLLTTKLHRPSVPPDIQPRPKLMDLMSRSLQLPLTLISAPAGYGKSTVATTWLEECGCPVAWVSLDEGENDPRSFLAFLVGAIQTRFPEIGRATMALTGASEIPAISHIQRQLLNDLNEIDEPFVLVLDDLHRVQDRRVMELLAGLLQHPPRHLHLLLLTRWDPALPLNSLRARGQLLEIGADDLRFTLEETTRYLATLLDSDVDQRAAAALEKSTEGWVTGIRLAALSIRTPEELDRIVKGMRGDFGYISSYLLDEVLSALPPEKGSLLLQTSVLDRFSADLCEAMWIPHEGVEAGEGEEAPGAAGNVPRGAPFLEWARKGQLFLVPLDLEGRWFRYHHLFQSLLQAELKRRWSPEKVAKLHLGASRWFAENGLPDEAIRHALAGGDVDAAVKVVEENRFSLLTLGQWAKLDDWLSLLPQDVKNTRPHLLLSQAWVADFRARPGDIVPVLGLLESIFETNPPDRALFQEFAYYKGFLQWWTDQPGLSLETLGKAVAINEESPGIVRANAELYHGMALQSTGDLNDAVRRLKNLTDPRNKLDSAVVARAYTGLAFIYLFAGLLKEAFHSALRLVTLCESTGDSYAGLFGLYAQGGAAFRWNSLEDACHFLEMCVSSRFTFHRRTAVDAMAGLAIAHQMLHRPEKAREALRTADEFSEWTQDPQIIGVAKSARARIALLEGDVDSASAWERTFADEPSSVGGVFFIENPFLTQCRVLLAQGSPESLPRALALLRHLDDLYKLYHNECIRIEVAVLEVATLKKLGRDEEAVEALIKVLARAISGRWIRPFVELGPPMAELLKEVRNRDVAVQQIRDILDRFPEPGRSGGQAPLEATEIEEGGEAHSAGPSGLGQLLTEREVDVLLQLSKGFSNKAIARNMNLSIETVKKHLYNAFKKLNVNNRVAALTRAGELGILQND